MKSEVVSEPARTAPANAVVTVASDQLGLPAADDDEDADQFKETPTLANRAQTLAAEAADGGAELAGPGSPGSYRMLRPSVTDVIEAPCMTKADTPGAAKRTVIGAARIRR